MSKIDKSRWLRDEAMHDRAVEAQHRIAPGHMTMRAVTALEHKRVVDNYARLMTLWAMWALVALTDGTGWLHTLSWWALVGGAVSWLAWFFIDKHRTKTRVLKVLENHEYLKYEAAAERY